MPEMITISIPSAVPPKSDERIKAEEIVRLLISWGCHPGRFAGNMLCCEASERWFAGEMSDSRLARLVVNMMIMNPSLRLATPTANPDGSIPGYNPSYYRYETFTDVPPPVSYRSYINPSPFDPYNWK